MQAISSDILVTQALQSSDLQLSNINNNSSSSNVSFADMLNSINKQSEIKENVKESDYNPDERVSQNKNAEKTETSDKVKKEEVDDKKSAEKTDEKENLSQNKEVDKTEQKIDKKSQTKDDLSKKEVLSKYENDVKKDSDVKNQETKKSEKSDKKITKDFEKLEDFVENQNVDEQQSIQASQNVYVADNNLQNVKNVEDKNNLKLDNELVINEDDLTKYSVEERITTLDKDGKIVVRDQRTQFEPDEKSDKNQNKFSNQIKFENESTATITMDVQNQLVEENVLSLTDQNAASDGSNFKAMLNNQIQTSAPDFVKTGTILLKDNNKGTINLVLHPDDLGNVKIQLSMDGKTVSAHITVNTKEALEVFKDNAQTLREAFANSGFDTANFDVSYNGNSNGQNQNSGFENLYDNREYAARITYNDSFDEREDGYIQENIILKNNSEYSINIVA